MKQPMLIGLNDNLKDNALLTRLRSCMDLKDTTPAMNPLINPNEIPLDYRLLTSVGKENDKQAVTATYSVWSALLNLTKKQEIDAYRFKVNVNVEHPSYLSLNNIPLFTDSFGNKIFVHIRENPIHQYLLQNHFYGKTNKKIDDSNTDFIYRRVRFALDGDGWKETAVRLFALHTGNTNMRESGVYTNWNIVEELERLGVGQTKLNKPVLIDVQRRVRDSVAEVAGSVVPVLQFANAIVGSIFGIDPSTISKINQSLTQIQNIVSNPGAEISASQLKTIGDVLAPNLLESGYADSAKYLNQGVQAYNLYKQKNYVELAKVTELSRFDLANFSPFDNYLSSKNIPHNMPADKFNEVNGIQQNFRNLLMIDEFQKAGFNPGSSNIMNKLDMNHTLTAVDEMFNYMVMTSGGGYVGALPTRIGGNEIIPSILDKLNLSEQNVLVHHHFLRSSLGFPTGTSVFDELILTSIENQIIKGNLREYVIPAQLPPVKANCIKEELTKYGVIVKYAGYNVDMKLPKEREYTAKANVRVLRNFK
jgi:hypothetical protein